MAILPESYINDPSLNHSMLCKFYYNPYLEVCTKLGLTDRPVSSSLLIGDAVDTYILDNKNFFNNFEVIPNLITPSSPNEKDFVNYIVTEKMEYLLAYVKSYSTKSKSDNQISKDALALYNKFEPYIEFYRNVDSTKKTIDDYVFRSIRKTEEKAKELKWYNYIIDNMITSKHVKATILGLNVKGLIDITIEGDNPAIIDLKSTSVPFKSIQRDILSHFNKYNYFTQVCFYALIHYLEQNPSVVINTDLEYKHVVNDLLNLKRVNAILLFQLCQPNGVYFFKMSDSTKLKAYNKILDYIKFYKEKIMPLYNSSGYLPVSALTSNNITIFHI